MSCCFLLGTNQSSRVVLERREDARVSGNIFCGMTQVEQVNMVARKQLAVFIVSLLLCGTALPRNYPLKIDSTNGHLLVDQSNVPFLMVGDSPQALIVNLSEADAAMFFANRSAYGFNTVWINLLCATYTGGRVDGSTIDGILPFTNTIPSTSSYDLTTPNKAYFTHVDRILNLAGQYGLQVLLDPVETGGWLTTMLDNGTNKCRAYGQYLGNRYKDFPNIIWMSGNDFQNWRGLNNDAVVLAIAHGIQDRDTRHIHTIELDYPVRSSLDDTNWASIINLNATYTYLPTYAQLLLDYNRPNFLPNFMVEANYEFEDNFHNLGVPIPSTQVLRRQEYWTMLSGATGQLYGNHSTWQFLPDWQSNLNTPGTIQLGYLKALFESRAWYGLIPDQDHSVVINGYGTFTTNGSVITSDYATAARTADGNTVIAYLPTRRTFSVNMSRISGSQSKAWWFNPQAGSTTNFATYPNIGVQSFTPPDTNDWLLVLDDAAALFAPPGSATGPLEVITSSLTNGAVGFPYSIQFQANGGIQPYSWSQVSNSAPIPTGLSCSTNGVLSGTPATNGTFNLIVMVADSTTATVTQNLRLTIETHDTTPPTAPAGLTVMAVSSSQINLSWGTSTDNVAVTGYWVERCQGAGCTNFTQVATLPGTNYSNMRLPAGTSYSYQVLARDAAGNLSGYSAVASATTLSASPPSTGPVAAYDFEEGTGTTVADWSGNGNTGSINGATWTPQGKSGSALSFSGSSWIIMNDSESLNLVNGVTLEAWVYPTASSGWSTAIFKEEFHDLAYGLFPSSGAGLPNISMITSSGLQGIDGTSALPLNTWSHLAGTYDGVNLQLYVNGIQAASAPASGSISTSTNALYVGGNPVFGEFFLGTIDDVRIYNRALNQIEIQSDMNSVPPLFVINRAELVPSRVNLYFTAAAGQSYAVEYRDSLTSGSWLTLTNINVPPVLTNRVVASLDISQPQRFYHVKNVSQPDQPVDFHLVMLAPGILNLNVTASAGQSYAVEYRDFLNSGSWLTLTNLSMPPVLTNLTATDFNTSQSQRFYQLKNLSPTGQPATFDQAELLPASFDLYFNAAANRAYTVEYRDALSSGSWQSLSSINAPPVTTNLMVSDFTLSQPQRFYRVKSP